MSPLSIGTFQSLLCVCLVACGASSQSTSELARTQPGEPSSGGEVRPNWTGAAPPPTTSYAAGPLAAQPRAQAQAQSHAPKPSARAAVSPESSGEARAVGSDGVPGLFLIYQAELHMAVYKVEQIQAQAIASTRELGGHLSEHVDRTRLVLRVPAARFDQALARIEGLGETTHRFVRALDVTAASRDLEMRLRNAEAVRDRLLKLLDKASDVKQSLAVEAELDRVAERIEQMKGQLKLMSDQIAFSTIMINFTVKRSETVGNDFELPFPWLRTLGLQHLLSFQ